MPRQLGPVGTQLTRHMGPPGPKMGGGGEPYACDTGNGQCNLLHIHVYHAATYYVYIQSNQPCGFT